MLIVPQEKEQKLNENYKLTKVSVFASLLKDIHMGYRDTVLPEFFLEKHNVKYLTSGRKVRQIYNGNFCLFGAVALHLNGNDKLEEETAKFSLFLAKSEVGVPSKLQVVQMNDIAKVEDNLQLKNILYDNDFFDGELLGELARINFQKHYKNVKVLPYNNHICYVGNINAIFKAFRCIPMQ